MTEEMKALLERIADYDHRLMMLKGSACRFLSDNCEALGIEEPRFSETEGVLKELLKRHAQDK